MASHGIDEDMAFADMLQRLVKKYPDFPQERIEQIVNDVRAEMATAKVRDFVPVLAEREVKTRIKLERA